MKAIVNKPLAFFNMVLEPGAELEVDSQGMPNGLARIISPSEYKGISISTGDIDVVKEAQSHE